MHVTLSEELFRSHENVARDAERLLESDVAVPGISHRGNLANLLPSKVSGEIIRRNKDRVDQWEVRSIKQPTLELRPLQRLAEIAKLVDLRQRRDVRVEVRELD